jgi:predicted transposase/invertase (TIGR01784 family)
MDRILNPKNDFAFKKVFGKAKHKNILIAFLNDIFEGVQEKIEDVEFLPLHQNAEIAMLRQSIIDVLCRDKDGNSWIIEMQCARDSSFIKRATSYACRVYLNQKNRSKDKNAGQLRQLKTSNIPGRFGLYSVPKEESVFVSLPNYGHRNTRET